MMDNDFQIKMKNWWQNLAAREQRIVAVGALAASIMLFYLLIWGPYLDRIDAMRKEIQSGYKTLAWMQTADAEIRKLENQSAKKESAVSLVTLLGILQRQVDQAGLTSSLTQLKQAAQDSIEMHFQKVAFDKLMGLLITVMKEQSVSVTHFSVVADAAPGVVNADVVLRIG